MKCRHCAAPLTRPVIDLGTAPPSNAYLRREQLDQPERWYPLRVLVCDRCWLVQTQDFAQADQLFDADYAYFSSFSTSWLEHARRYVDTMVSRFGLGSQQLVIEIASNDGYLLQYVRERGIPCLGVEPTAGTAAASRARGIETMERFFGRGLAGELVAAGRSADLLVANNVLAHVPDINDFIAGCATLLSPAGVATFEFPHLLRLLAEAQFDTIYHEHYSYLSLGAVRRIFSANGLAVFDVEELPTHGGSLRVFARRADAESVAEGPAVTALLRRESEAGLDAPRGYAALQGEAEAIRDGLLRFLLDCKQAGLRVAAYGAAAKGNTLLNFAGVKADLLPLVVDLNPAKQGKFMPGSRIPIGAPEDLTALRPQRILLLPWNLRAELSAQLDYTRAWGARLVTAVPRLVEWP